MFTYHICLHKLCQHCQRAFYELNISHSKQGRYTLICGHWWH